MLLVKVRREILKQKRPVTEIRKTNKQKKKNFRNDTAKMSRHTNACHSRIITKQNSPARLQMKKETGSRWNKVHVFILHGGMKR